MTNLSIGTPFHPAPMAQKTLSRSGSPSFLAQPGRLGKVPSEPWGGKGAPITRFPVKVGHQKRLLWPITVPGWHLDKTATLVDRHTTLVLGNQEET